MVRYAAHQLNLWPRISLPETSPTMRWTGKVGDASVFRVWGSRAFVRDTSANKLSPHAIPCVFLGFVPDAPGWQFYHPTSRCVFPSQDVRFEESVPFYRLFHYRSAPPPPPSPFLAPSPPPVDPLPHQGPDPSGVSQVDPLPGPAPVQVAVGSGAASGGAASWGAELGGAESEGAGSGGAKPGGAESEGAEPRGAALSGGPAGASPRLSLQQLREWFVWHACLQSGATGAGGAGDAEARGDGVIVGAGGTGGTAATSPGGAHTRGTGAAGTGGVEGAGALDPGAGGAGDNVRLQPYFVPLLKQLASPLPAPYPYIEQSGGLTERREPASRPVSPARTARCVPRSRPPLVLGAHTMALHPSSVPLCLPLPPPPESSLPEVLDPKFDHTRAATPTVARLLAIAVTDPSFESTAASVSTSPPSVGGECALGTDVLEDRLEEFECLEVAIPRFASMLLAPEGDPDATDIPTPRSYGEAITGPYSSVWQAAMDAEMASWKSTGTYIDEVPPPGVNIVDGIWIFRVMQLPGSPPDFKARYVARGFIQRQGVDDFHTFSPIPKMTTLRVLLHVAAQHDYELHSLDFSTAFLQGSLYEEIWLRHPPGFIGSFPADLGFAPSTADSSLFLRTDTSLPPFYVLVYVDDLVRATADTEALTLVKLKLRKRHTCTDLGELRSYLGLQITWDRARRPITLTQSHLVHQSVEPSGPYPELVGFLMYLMACTRPDVAYPLSLLARYVAPGRHRKVHWDVAKRVLRYLCSTLGMGLVLGGRGPVVLTGHRDASWADDSATQRSSSCDAKIYAGSMAAQELRWLIYLLTDLGEQPRSPPVLYVDNKAMIALCQEHRLEHRTKHIALRYFLARELQQRGQLCLAYVATRANTADVFTKALPPSDH
ncbi:unnamed protein product [Closterium sp. NIES-53]